MRFRRKTAGYSAYREIGMPKDRSNLVAVTDLPWRSAILFQPLREIHELDFVLDTNIRDRHFDNVEPLGDSGNPFVGSNRCEPGNEITL